MGSKASAARPAPHFSEASRLIPPGSNLMKSLLIETAERAASYLDSLAERRVAPTAEDLERLSLLDMPLPEKPGDPQSILRMLDEIGSPATVASAGGRFFE